MSCLVFLVGRVAHFEGKGVPWAHLLGNYEHPGCFFFPNRCALASFGWFFDGGDV